MKKTILFLMTLLVMVALSLNVVAAQDTTTMRFWIASQASAGPEQAVAAWNAANPSIQVELVPYSNNPEGNTQLDTALLAEGQVDVVVGYGIANLQRRAAAGLIEPLDPYLGEFNVEEEFLTSRTIFDGSTWAFPAQSAPALVYLNQQALDAAGLEVPTEWTWDEFREYARALTISEGPIASYGLMLNAFQVDTWAQAIQGGDAFFTDECTTNFDDPLWTELLTLRNDLEATDASTVPWGDLTAGRLTLQNEFFSGNVAMVVSSPFVLRYVPQTTDLPRDFTVTFAPLPTLPNAEYTHRPGIMDDFVSVAANSANPEAAAQFAQWFATEGYLELSAFGRLGSWTGYEPAQLVDVFIGRLENAETLLDPDALRNALSFMADQSYAEPTIFTGLTEVTQIFNEETERMLLGEQTPEAAAANMKRRGDEVLATLCG